MPAFILPTFPYEPRDTEQLMTSDVRILLQLMRGMPRSADPAARLEAFYAPQAASYDSFRERLLHGRRELVESLRLRQGASLIELGAGTGSNLDILAERVAGLHSVELVDLCPSLLAQARLRAARHPNVRVIAGDACDYRPDAPVDCVVFSYSLTMIPEWARALDNAVDMLRTGGELAVVDFTLPGAGQPLARWFWKNWFGHDGVRLDDGHVTALRRLLPSHQLTMHLARVPYLPALRVPYYTFVGCKN
jgi:S-adenosylmethionine-diacylgycerolhomoserine-N-methlytransferase